MASLAELVRDIKDELSSQFYERDDAIEALILGLLTKEHVHLDGPPGTSKSLLVRSLAQRITDAKYFEQILSKTRPDASVLGPYDISLLREKSEFRRKDAGYLTDAHIAFIDEAWKMSPTLGHDLLAIFNERMKHEVDGEGRTSHTVPLWSAFTASNELPTESDAAALWDRILLRVRVDYLASRSEFYSLLDNSTIPGADIGATISLEGIRMAHDEVLEVNLPMQTLDQVGEIRETLKKDGVVVSDRRWRASTKVLRATAWLAGRDQVEVDDLTVLNHILWSSPDELKVVRRNVLAVARPDSEEVEQRADELAALVKEWDTKKDLEITSRTQALVEFNTKVEKLSREVKKVRDKTAAPRTKVEAEGLLRQIIQARRDALAAGGLALPGMDDEETP